MKDLRKIAPSAQFFASTLGQPMYQRIKRIESCLRDFTVCLIFTDVRPVSLILINIYEHKANLVQVILFCTVRDNLSESPQGLAIHARHLVRLITQVRENSVQFIQVVVL